MSYLSGDGIFWWATKNRCSILKRPHAKLEEREKACKKKGFPIGYRTDGSEYSFLVTDERLEQMEEDGTLEILQSTGTQVRGGADPLYFTWATKVSEREKKPDVKNVGSTQIAAMYPFMEIDFWSRIGDIYTGTKQGKKHHATIKTIQDETDIELLKSVLKDTKSVLSTIEQQSSSLAKEVIEASFQRANKIAGEIPIFKLLTFGKDRIERLIRITEASLRDIKEELEERIEELQAKSTTNSFFPFLNIDLNTSNTSNTSKEDDTAASLLGAGGILIILGLL